MNARLEPGDHPGEPDADLEATDGGWDPYVTSLLLMNGQAAARESHDEDDAGAPVMSFSRKPRKRAR